MKDLFFAYDIYGDLHRISASQFIETDKPLLTRFTNMGEPCRAYNQDHEFNGSVHRDNLVALAANAPAEAVQKLKDSAKDHNAAACTLCRDFRTPCARWIIQMADAAGVSARKLARYASEGKVKVTDNVPQIQRVFGLLPPIKITHYQQFTQ